MSGLMQTKNSEHSVFRTDFGEDLGLWNFEKDEPSPADLSRQHKKIKDWIERRKSRNSTQTPAMDKRLVYCVRNPQLPQMVASYYAQRPLYEFTINVPFVQHELEQCFNTGRQDPHGVLQQWGAGAWAGQRAFNRADSDPEGFHFYDVFPWQAWDGQRAFNRADSDPEGFHFYDNGFEKIFVSSAGKWTHREAQLLEGGAQLWSASKENERLNEKQECWHLLQRCFANMFPVEESDKDEWLQEQWYEPIVGLVQPSLRYFGNPNDRRKPIFFFKCESIDQKCIIDVSIFANFAKVHYRGPINIQHFEGSPAFLARARAKFYASQGQDGETWQDVQEADDIDVRNTYEHDENKRDRIAYNYRITLEWGDKCQSEIAQAVEGGGKCQSKIAQAVNQLRIMLITLERTDWTTPVYLVRVNFLKIFTLKSVFLKIFTVENIVGAGAGDVWENMTWNFMPHTNGVIMESTNHKLLETYIHFRWRDEDILAETALSPNPSPNPLKKIEVWYSGPFELAQNVNEPTFKVTFHEYERGIEGELLVYNASNRRPNGRLNRRLQGL
jgi:hypothetical protein